LKAIGDDYAAPTDIKADGITHWDTDLAVPTCTLLKAAANPDHVAAALR
jgi:hypothetical protein